TKSKHRTSDRGLPATPAIPIRGCRSWRDAGWSASAIARVILLQPMASLYASRVVLRPFRDEDVTLLHGMFQDEELARIVPQPIHADLEASKQLLARIRAQHASGTSVGWVIVLRDGAKPIGTCGLVRIDRDAMRADVAYYVLREHWGTGLA